MAAPKYETGCKLGTIPHVVRVHRGDRIEPERLLRIQERPGAPWSAVLVRSVQPCGHFKADLWLSEAPIDRPQPAAGQYAYRER